MHAARDSQFGRLTKRSDFLTAARGRRFHTDRLTMQGSARTPPPDGVRLGFTVTKRVGHATERNRIKRRLRRAVAALAAGRSDAPSFDIVVVARRTCLDAPFTTLVEDLARAFEAVTTSKSPKKPRPVTPDRPSRGTGHA